MGEGAEYEGGEEDGPEGVLHAEDGDIARCDEGVHDAAEEVDGDGDHSRVAEGEDEHEEEEALALLDLAGEECAPQLVCGVAVAHGQSILSWCLRCPSLSNIA